MGSERAEDEGRRYRLDQGCTIWPAAKYARQGMDLFNQRLCAAGGDHREGVR
ncbi:hypothetical protein D3C78_1026750 [compost metagenome]